MDHLSQYHIGRSSNHQSSKSSIFPAIFTTRKSYQDKLWTPTYWLKTLQKVSFQTNKTCIFHRFYTPKSVFLLVYPNFYPLHPFPQDQKESQHLFFWISQALESLWELFKGLGQNIPPRNDTMVATAYKWGLCCKKQNNPIEMIQQLRYLYVSSLVSCCGICSNMCLFAYLYVYLYSICTFNVVTMHETWSINRWSLVNIFFLFPCLVGARCTILVRVQFQCQLSVSLTQFWNTSIVVPTAANNHPNFSGILAKLPLLNNNHHVRWPRPRRRGILVAI